MSEKRFQVVFTGRLVAGMQPDTVMSNLMLDLGLTEDKARILLERSGVVLKRFPAVSEAQRLAERFERAGIRCVVEDRAERSAPPSDTPSSNESSLISFISRFKPVR